MVRPTPFNFNTVVGSITSINTVVLHIEVNLHEQEENLIYATCNDRTRIKPSMQLNQLKHSDWPGPKFSTGTGTSEIDQDQIKNF